MTNKTIQAANGTPAAGAASATQPQTVTTLPADYLEWLADHVGHVLHDWLKANAPGHVFAAYTGAISLRLAAQAAPDQRDDICNVDETVIEVLKALCAAGATFGDGLTLWTARPSEVQS